MEMERKDYFVYFNAHPEGKIVGDCVKRAIAVATGIPYKETSLLLNRLKKETGAEKFNSKTNYEAFLKAQPGFKKLSFPAVKGQPRMTPAQFTKEFPTGSYVLRLAHHLVAVVDGKVYDTWDSTENCVYNAFKVDRTYPIESVRNCRRVTLWNMTLDSGAMS